MYANFHVAPTAGCSSPEATHSMHVSPVLSTCVVHKSAQCAALANSKPHSTATTPGTNVCTFLPLSPKPGVAVLLSRK